MRKIVLRYSNIFEKDNKIKIMKFKKIALATITVFTLLTISCREKKQESTTTTIIKEKEVAPATTEKKGLFEKVGDAVDNRVNSEIDKGIKKIEE